MDEAKSDPIPKDDEGPVAWLCAGCGEPLAIDEGDEVGGHARNEMVNVGSYRYASYEPVQVQCGPLSPLYLRPNPPDLAAALDELAVAREALRWRDRTERPAIDSTKHARLKVLVRDRDGWVGLATVMADGRWLRTGKKGRSYPPDAWLPVPEAALSGPAGKLAAEVLRAAVRRRRAHLRLRDRITVRDEDQPDWREFDALSADQFEAKQAEDLAVDAFLAAFPSFGQEGG